MQRIESEREASTSEDLLVVCMVTQVYTVEYQLEILNVYHSQKKSLKEESKL